MAEIITIRVYGLMAGGWYEREREYRLYPTALGRAVAALLAQPAPSETEADPC